MRKELGPATFALLVTAWLMGGIEQENAVNRASAAAAAATANAARADADQDAGPPLGDSVVERETPPVPAESPSGDADTTSPLLALEKGESLPADSRPTDSGGVATSPESPLPGPADLSAFVHRMTVRTQFDAGNGSATHIGNGVYLTCKHLFERPYTSVEIDAEPVVVTGMTVVTTMDFAIVRTKAVDSPAAETFTDELPAELSLTVVGAKTGEHAGTLSATTYIEGYRDVRAAASSTESGDSGAGVFDDQHRLVGVHWGSRDGRIYFTPLARVRHLIGGDNPPPHAAAALPAARTSRRQSGHWETRCFGDHCRQVWVPRP